MEDGSEQSLETLPSAGLMRRGLVYPLPKLGQATLEIDGGFLPTPLASSSQSASMEASLREAKRLHPKGYNHLAAQVASELYLSKDGEPKRTLKDRKEQIERMYPTPRAGIGMDMTLTEGMANLRHKKYLETEIAYLEGAPGGKLNPAWVEWLMGFPIQHTALKP